MPKAHNLKNKRFGKLIVIERIPYIKGDSCAKWICLCDCGNTKQSTSQLLTQGHTTHCGCVKYQPPSGNQSKIWKGFGEIHSAIFWGIKRHAKSRNIPFNITIQQIWALFLKQERKCALSGLLLKFWDAGHYKKHNSTASLDRIDSSKGYTIDNIQWIHKDINLMKMNLQENKLIEYCRLIADKSRS